MHFLYRFVMLIFVIYETLEFIVRGSVPLVAPLGGSIILPCYVETSMMENVKVIWSRTDSEALVHLYQDGESRPEAQQQEYHDRAHFFTDQIQHGNFSLLLENIRAEDKGVYRCKVYSQQVADKTLVEIKAVDCLLVSDSDESISASVGEDVTLNCSVDSHIKPEHIEEVSWKKTDEDMLVLLYQNNEILSDSSDEQYRDRVEFFSDEIPKGNFSLRLKGLRTEDKGVYLCQVKAGRLSANATAVLKILGFSGYHTTVLILCIISIILLLSGSALLFCSRPENGDKRLYLLVSLLLCPNITMLLASIIWRVIEGSLYETIICCVLYILRPLRFWVTPSATGYTDQILKYVMTSHADHAAFMSVMYSVLLAEHFKDINTVIRNVIFGLLFLMCLLFIIHLAKEKILSCFGGPCRRMYSKVQPFVAACSFSLLPSLQLALLLYIRFASSAVFSVAVLSMLYGFLYYFHNETSRTIQCCLCFLDKLFRSMMIVMSLAMVYFYITLLRNEQDDAGLICVAGILQVLWVLAFSEVPFHYLSKVSIVFFLLHVLFFHPPASFSSTEA